MKIQKISLNNKGFPKVLKDIPQPPKQLYVLGDIEPMLLRPRLGVVGSRKATPYGREVTQRLAGEAAGKGIVIVSGLALGVDSIAHQAALDAGGLTIAVLPCGLDAIYPSSHYHLAKQIVANGGALISEYPEGMPALRNNFIERNRIISGMSDALLITEAAEKSGTMHTANFALEQGRTVMAVPGNVTNPNSKGTNNLIKSGALVVTETADVLFSLNIESASSKQVELFGSTPEETLLLNIIQSGISDGAVLLIESKLDANVFNQTLTMLEINGKIRPLGAGHWSIK